MEVERAVGEQSLTVCNTVRYHLLLCM